MGYTDLETRPPGYSCQSHPGFDTCLVQVCIARGLLNRIEDIEASPLEFSQPLPKLGTTSLNPWYQTIDQSYTETRYALRTYLMIYTNAPQAKLIALPGIAVCVVLANPRTNAED